MTLGLFLLLFSACGGADKTHNPQAGTSSNEATANEGDVTASAEEVAEKARADLICPPELKSPTRAPNAPVDDVLGVRPGLTYEEAEQLVLCSNDLLVATPDDRGFSIQTYGHKLRQGFTARFAEADVQKTPQQYMQEMSEAAMARSGNAVVQDMKPGQAKWYVATMGLPGVERVISAAREEWFAESKNPTVKSVETALVGKYGTPTQRQQTSNLRLRWAYDTYGRLLTESSPLFSQCNGSSSPDGGTSFSPDCGLVVEAVVSPLPNNAELGQSMQVGVVDQAGGFEALNKTEQALQKMDLARKAQEVEAATKNADQPKL